MQHYGVNGYSLHAMNSLSAMYNLHQQAAQQAQHAPDYRPSVHALTLAERLAGKKLLNILTHSRTPLGNSSTLQRSNAFSQPGGGSVI